MAKLRQLLNIISAQHTKTTNEDKEESKDSKEIPHLPVHWQLSSFNCFRNALILTEI
jgi:hypothetical protein